MSKFKSSLFKTLIFGLSFCILVFGFCIFSSYAEDAKEEEALFVAQKAFEDGFFEVSLGILERFLKTYPESPKAAEANLLIGRCYFNQNRFLDALKKFDELLNEPKARDIQDAVNYWIAELHFKGNNFSKAAYYYKKIIDEFPKSSYIAAAYYSLGWCLFQELKFSEALDNFKIVESKFTREPQAQDAILKIVECLYNLKDYSGLEEKAKSYLKSYPKDTARTPYLFFYIAEADYYLNNFTEAVNEYLKVLPSTADNKVKELSKLGIAWAYLKSKRYKDAEEAFLAVNAENLEKASQDSLFLGKAILMAENKKFNEAKDIYSQLLNTTSDEIVLIQAYLGKADASYNMADYKDAISSYKEGIDKATDNIPREIIDKLHYGLSWSYLKEGEFKNAIDEFQRVAKYSEDKIVKVSALCQIGDAYQDSGDYDKALETYDTILKDYPDNIYSDYVQYQVGLILLKLGKYDGAIIAFQSLKDNFPNSKLVDDAYYALGLSYFQREDYNASKDTFVKFDSEFKDSSLRPQAIYLLGSSLYNLGKFPEAIEVFKNIVKTYNQDTELVQKAEYEIADCFYQMGNEKEAMNRFKALRSKYPDSSLTAEIMWWLGEYYYRHNDSDMAQRYFSSLIQDFPKSSLIPDAYYALGSLCIENDKKQDAINNFKKVMELGKSDLAGTATIAVADIYAREGQADLALNTYKEVINNYSNLAHLVYPKIGDIYRNSANYNEAMEYYQKSLEVVPIKEMSDIQFKIAEIKQAQGKIDEAIEEYLKVTYLYPDNNDLLVKSLLRVADIYEDKQDFKEALNIYKRIAAMDVKEAKYAQERIDWITARIK